MWLECSFSQRYVTPEFKIKEFLTFGAVPSIIKWISVALCVHCLHNEQTNSNNKCVNITLVKMKIFRF